MAYQRWNENIGCNLPSYTPTWFVFTRKRLNPKPFFYKEERMQFYQSVVIMDPRLKHLFPTLVAGPTCCGKTQFVKRLLEAGEDMIDGTLENIIWCYGMYQPAYDEMQRTICNITFIEGVPSDLESMINPSIRNLVVLDDLMQELSNNNRITNLFTKGCHHRNLSVIFLLQNIFHRGRQMRDTSLNCHYLILFKSPRDSSQSQSLGQADVPWPYKIHARIIPRPVNLTDICFVILNRIRLATSG